MSGRNAYKATGAWDYVEKALKDNGIGYVNYAEVTPNPTTHHVNDAAKLAKDFGAKAVIAIGGGSPTDAGKSVAILLEYPEKLLKIFMILHLHLKKRLRLCLLT